MASTLPLRPVTDPLDALPDALPDRPTVPAPLLVSRRQLAAMLSVSLATLDRLAAAGKLPRPVRLAGSVRWRLDEVSEWVRADCPDARTWDALRRQVGGGR